jgi:hypothetical protein
VRCIATAVDDDSQNDEYLGKISIRIQKEREGTLTVIVITLRRLNQYSSCSDQFRVDQEKKGGLTSP